jgi:hypothetical protein
MSYHEAENQTEYTEIYIIRPKKQGRWRAKCSAPSKISVDQHYNNKDVLLLLLLPPPPPLLLCVCVCVCACVHVCIQDVSGFKNLCESIIKF